MNHEFVPGYTHNGSMVLETNGAKRAMDRVYLVRCRCGHERQISHAVLRERVRRSFEGCEKCARFGAENYMPKPGEGRHVCHYNYEPEGQRMQFINDYWKPATVGKNNLERNERSVHV